MGAKSLNQAATFTYSAAVAELAGDGIALGRRSVEAIVAHDWEGVAAYFAPDARFVAVVPKERPFREKAGSEEAAGLIRDWFGDADAPNASGDAIALTVRAQARQVRGFGERHVEPAQSRERRSAMCDCPCGQCCGCGACQCGCACSAHRK